MRCEIESPVRAGMPIVFCVKCGAYCEDYRPGDLLRAGCSHRPRSAQVRHQLKRIHDGKHPHGRASSKNVAVSQPRGLSEAERDLMSVRCSSWPSPAAGILGLARLGYASREA
eukprot:3269186-Pyramimonas_sp.AAC.1